MLKYEIGQNIQLSIFDEVNSTNRCNTFNKYKKTW